MAEENKKEYPKYHNYSIYIFVVILILAWFVGRTIFTNASRLYGDVVWGFAIASVVGTYIINIALYEVGKLIAGKLSGYNLIYTSIFGFKFYKTKENKTKFKLSSLENYGGNTLMAPKSEDYSKCKPVLYLLGGSIFITIVDCALIALGFVLRKNYMGDYFLYVSLVNVTIGGIIIILNLAPFLTDSLGDGFNLRLILYTKENYKIYHDNLYQLEALYTAKHDLKEFTYDDYHNLLSCEAALYQYYYYIDHDDMKKAEEYIDIILNHIEYALDEEKGRAYSFKFYFRLLRGEGDKAADDYWALEKPYRKACNNSSDYECLKTSLLVASFIDLNYDLYEYITTKIDKKKNAYYYPLRKETEDKLIQKSLDYIEAKKPEWFGQYNNEDENTDDSNEDNSEE